jgi:transposase
MRDWLPADHLVWFVIDVVRLLDTRRFQQRRATRSWTGPRPYHPDMLLALLVYGYAQGQRSSRRIEALCEVDVAFRVVCGGDPPDHSTLARFRSANLAAFTEFFEQVLTLCAQAGMVRLGTVAIDGTKIAADASLGANRSEDWLREQVDRIVAEAEAADAAEDDLFGPDRRGDELPEDLRDPVTRDQRIRAAADRAAADRAERQARAAAEDASRADYLDRVRAGDPTAPSQPPAGLDPVELAEARVQAARRRAEARRRAWQAKADQAAARGRRLPGTPPDPPDQALPVLRAKHALDTARQNAAPQNPPTAPPGKANRYNITDPDSRIMPTRNGWIQGYNAQLAVTADWLVLGVTLTQNPADTEQFTPMMHAAVAAAERLAPHRPPSTSNQPSSPAQPAAIGLVLADAGYLSTDNLTTPGPDRLIAAGKHRDLDRAARDNPAHGPPPDTAGPIERMRHRLRTPHGATAYKQRGATVETVNAHIKDIIGLRRFSMRGLTACTAELNLTAATANLLKLHGSLATTG